MTHWQNFYHDASAQELDRARYVTAWWAYIRKSYPFLESYSAPQPISHET